MDNNNNQNWGVADYHEKYKLGILSLFKSQYTDSSLWKEDFFNFQHFKNPAGKSIIKLAVNTKDEVVGFYCVIPQMYYISNKIVKGSISLNTLVRDDFRKKGIFTTLASTCFETCKKENIVFTLGFPNPNSYPGFVNKLGFTDMGEMPLLIKPINISNIIAVKTHIPLLGTLLKPFNFFFSGFKNKTNSTNRDLNVDNELASFWNKTKLQKNNMAVKNKEFIYWRTHWPHRTYKVITYTEKNKIRGYLIAGYIESEGIKNGLIVDFVIHKSNDVNEIGETLLHDAYLFWKKMQVDQIGCIISKNTDEYRVLIHNGFINCPQFLKPQPIVPIIKYHINNADAHDTQLKNWHFTMIDYDIA